MKAILVLGGTGAMGVPLVQQLAQENQVYVTTRRDVKSQSTSDSVTYIQGNAKDMAFLSGVLDLRHWDAIVDFMVWGNEFEQVAAMMLKSTEQYVFISSARVYAQSEEAITEQTPRLLDVCADEEYLKTNEYALAKAREEDLLLKSDKKNFTIVRPTITYNKYRLQLGVLEKENWLYRAIHGRSIVFSNDIAEKRTTMTYGDDVAKGIASLVGKEEARGEIFHVTCLQSLLWSDVLNIYLNGLEMHLGKRPRVVMTEKTLSFHFPARKYQIIYCRYFNRTFDNSKISKFCNVELFTSPEQGLKRSLEQFLNRPSFREIDWCMEALNDRVAKEKTPFSEIPGIANRIQYFLYRYNLRLSIVLWGIVIKIYSRIK